MTVDGLCGVEGGREGAGMPEPSDLRERSRAFACAAVGAATAAWWSLIAWATWSLLPAPAAALLSAVLAADLAVALSVARVSGRCSRLEEARFGRVDATGEAGSW